ncbi:RdgB/HAM1 family non-canonical purine NTP pyrophosphatase [Cohnella suwonensis]|uniref:dITP/XTP pyrophosphatase n=1 Tax=Cohnella suwonensis TaxID=696072 RepID=A0ABW0LSV6_9BACL
MIGSGGTVLVATRNRGKSKEFAEAFGKLGIAVKDLHDVEGMPDIEETGETFAENAYLKAKATADIVGIPVLADDSGLCVDELDGAPGVYSARYAGAGATDADNNAKLIRELLIRERGDRSEEDGEPETLSAARFKCVLVLYDPADGSKLEAEGSVEGAILREARGAGGFGYDPLFWLSSRGKSMAELTPADKNAISHRGNALRELLALIG